MSMTSTEKTLWLLPSVARPISYIWVAVSSFIQNVMELHQDIHAAIHWTSPRLPGNRIIGLWKAVQLTHVSNTLDLVCVLLYFIHMSLWLKIAIPKALQIWSQLIHFPNTHLWWSARSSASSSASNALIFGETPEGVGDMAGILRCFGWSIA